jgi:hypothetical protein
MCVTHNLTMYKCRRRRTKLLTGCRNHRRRLETLPEASHESASDKDTCDPITFSQCSGCADYDRLEHGIGHLNLHETS